ncbi:hypothetical protein EJ08DRAFT_738863 [Tothia fuscella]|uniref:Uncharacterized protein n=1 Tax=Tothia fuscella TaxID=1048955 RepID=A0A9P4TS89_9PEZI|nr:hypothetical protein EJ08DRAFT_738863 [Tothia fuscella]
MYQVKKLVRKALVLFGLLVLLGVEPSCFRSVPRNYQQPQYRLSTQGYTFRQGNSGNWHTFGGGDDADSEGGSDGASATNGSDEEGELSDTPSSPFDENPPSWPGNGHGNYLAAPEDSVRIVPPSPIKFAKRDNGSADSTMLNAPFSSRISAPSFPAAQDDITTEVVCLRDTTSFKEDGSDPETKEVPALELPITNVLEWNHKFWAADGSDDGLQAVLSLADKWRHVAVGAIVAGVVMFLWSF